jgi:hypothetical protein
MVEGENWRQKKEIVRFFILKEFPREEEDQEESNKKIKME